MKSRRRSGAWSFLTIGGMFVSALILYASTATHGAAAVAIAAAGIILMLVCTFSPAWTERGGRRSGRLYVATIFSYFACLALLAVALRAGSIWKWPSGIAGLVMFVVAHLAGARWRQYRRSSLLRPHHDVTEAFKQPSGGRRKAA